MLRTRHLQGPREAKLLSFGSLLCLLIEPPDRTDCMLSEELNALPVRLMSDSLL